MAKRKGKPLTRKDVLKAIEKNGGTAEGLDLSDKVFEAGIDLSSQNLRGIILRNADLESANFERTVLASAHLEGALLLEINLEAADLEEAHFERALLMGAHLGKAYLGATRLEGANLQSAHLEDTWLDNIGLSNDTRLENIYWGNYVLSVETEEYFGWAVDVYRQLKAWYTNAGMPDIAAKFYYREKEANRKSIKLCSRHRLAAEFMRAFFGYGEEWKRIFGWIAVVIFGLAGAYHFWGSLSPSSFLDSLYYSAASFTALGYGNWAPQPTGWAKGMGAAEAVIGVFMMALLLVTFVRKWTR